MVHIFPYCLSLTDQNRCVKSNPASFITSAQPINHCGKCARECQIIDFGKLLNSDVTEVWTDGRTDGGRGLHTSTLTMQRGKRSLFMPI